MKFIGFVILFFLCLSGGIFCAGVDDVLLEKEFQKVCLVHARGVLTRFVERQGSCAVPDFPERYLYPDYGVFITLEKGYDVRGCRGTLHPTHGTLRDEIAHNTMGAASRDSRFPPLTKNELGKVRISITIIRELAPLETVAALQKSEGIVAMSGERVGVVLPYEGSDPWIRCRWALKKACINPDEEGVTWYVLRGVRFKEEGVTP